MSPFFSIITIELDTKSSHRIAQFTPSFLDMLKDSIEQSAASEFHVLNSRHSHIGCHTIPDQFTKCTILSTPWPVMNDVCHLFRPDTSHGEPGHFSVISLAVKVYLVHALSFFKRRF